MNTNFKIQGLDREMFSSLFALSDEELTKRNIIRKTVDKANAFPCRVSLEDAEIGESVLLLSFEHLKTNSPYNSAGAIFIRENARIAEIAENEIPDMLTRRLLSLRAYDKNEAMIQADVINGTELKNVLHQWLENTDIDYIHIHNAKPGCYNCLVKRSV
ncbi:DUF1203 domain-containing protein [Elizabethkingia ursingii]|uniref:DUF1203 domain-containing protein n=1 Tax=Elizabethkingia ursingii TaxID=1756150 RepID=A0AAJ3NEQ3_9FLAO|nr:DUF1203 domain-containing protein [Elizabethkingia ursingii]AQX07775.1 hypothetical protein BBD34_03560 [Elizabethkingia ursingii]OPB79377.1 hypothetical protein BAY32_16875 [Elizabethkingia ursingii]